MLIYYTANFFRFLLFELGLGFGIRLVYAFGNEDGNSKVSNFMSNVMKLISCKQFTLLSRVLHRVRIDSRLVIKTFYGHRFETDSYFSSDKSNLAYVRMYVRVM